MLSVLYEIIVILHDYNNYAAETLRLYNKGLLENLKKKERNIIRTIFGPKFQNNQVKLIPNKELHTKIGKLSVTIRKRRIDFYSHLVGMNNNGLSKQIFDFFRSKKIKGKWSRKSKKI